MAIAQAKKYHGQETSSIQVLREAGIPLTKEEVNQKLQEILQKTEPQTQITTDNRSEMDLYQSVLKIYSEQSEGWKKRNLFERQWVARDFKKNTGLSIDEMLTTVKALGDSLKTGTSTAEYIEPIKKLGDYYVHQQEQLKGFEKNPDRLAANLQIIEKWVLDAKFLVMAIMK